MLVYKKVKVSPAMRSPLYGLTIPDKAGTLPGIVCSVMNPNKPSIANRPLLISALSPLAFFSALAFLDKPKGSK